jgi:hypothetical protein
LFNLNVDDFVGVAAEVPARAVAEVRKQGMDAGVGLLLAWFVLNFSVFYMDRVKGVYDDLPKLRTAARNLETQRAVVAGIDENDRDHNCSNRPEQRVLCA